MIRRGLAAAVLAVMQFAGASVAAAAAPAAPGSALLQKCRERFVIAPGDDAAVRARVPTKYELARDAAGKPLLYVTAITCERYVVGRTSRPTTAAAFAAMIKSPDGVGCTSQWPVVGPLKGDALSCNLYVLFAAYDNRAVVSWLRAGTPDLDVRYVRQLEFRESDLDLASLGRRLEFKTGPRTSSPFQMDAVVRERPVETPFTATFWAETASGTVRMRFESANLALGEAQGMVRATRGSEMARLLADETAVGAQPFTIIAGNRWGHGSLTKVVLPAGDQG